MNIECFLCKQKVFFYWALNKKLSDDIIELIIKILIPNENYLKEINNEIKNKFNSIKHLDNIYQESWHLINYGPNVNSISSWREMRKNPMDIITSKSDFYYRQNYLLPFLKNHYDNCECYQCTNKLDYPRHLYLYSKTIKKYRGDNSRLKNEWINLLYTIIQTKYYKENIKSYGFTSRYDFTDLKKKNYSEYVNPVITDKNACIEVKRIWKKHLLIT